MDDPPPPVPPKDTPVKPSMDADRATPAPPSSSKRKREEASDEHVYDRRSSHLEAPDFTGHSPKRSRPSLQPSDNDASDATPVQRNVRRKKGVNNLSNLNLRHAAERQARQHAESQPVPRESKFQEGSLTDKPSAQPPTAFTRFTRTDSGNIHLVDELMNDYHNGMTSPHRSVEIDDEQHKAQTAQPTSAIRSEAASTDENNSFFFRFGRSLAASFHPVRMWKQVWEETTEELRQKNLLELERKRALKEEAERRYAQMKASGQLEPRVLSRASAAGSDVTIRDSGLIFTSGTPNFGHRRDMSDGSQLVPPSIDISTASESESREVVPKASKTFRSRLSFKRPSLQNLQFGIKRTKSEFNIAAAANAQRDSSSSVSPVKADMGDPALKKSQSKVDLRKQYKLSKRVSNLETKLQLARRELDEALVQASPMPKLGNKYERFTPNSTLTRSTFVPGRLESLPSERILDPSQFDFELDGSNQGMDDHVEASHATEGASNEQAKADDLMDAGDEDDEETMKVSRARPYPPRASSLFNLRNKNIEDARKDTVDHIEPAQNDTEYDNMNTNDDADGNNETRKGSKKAASYATLDAKLKALDANVNMANRRPSHRRKRKSGEDQKDYKPEDDVEDDDDDEWGRIGGKTKRRKSAGTTRKKAARKSGTFGDEPATQSNDQEAENNDAEATQPTDASNVHTSARKSLDSQHAALEPVAEEEADEAAFANRDPSKKPADSPQQASSDEIKTRAAAVAQKHRSHSPSGPERAASHQAIDGSHEQATAGSAKSTRGRPKKGKAKVDESFEWPEDVF